MNNILEKIVAHRGESFEAPENSLSAINMAWEKGARAVEIDIHLTADNEIVIIHDKHTGRVGDKKLFVKKSKLHELKSVDVGIKKNKVFKGERIPTLNEVIETVPVEAKLVIEVKCGKEIINPLVELLKCAKLMIECVLDINENPYKIIKKIKDNGLDGVDVWAGKVINKSFVKAFKEDGLCFYVWTVNDLGEAHRVLGYGVDAITTDRAEWISKQLLGTKQ
jgi:glycerophosphoryl diester phosphodiesterase